jgi:hypothetical protein
VPRAQEGAKSDRPNVFVLGLIVFTLVVPGIIVIVGKA